MPHISFSELKDWKFCPFYHKLSRIEKLASFEGNEYTAFGTAIHTVCEKKLLHEVADESLFAREFASEIEKLIEKHIELDGDLISKMKPQGRNIIPEIDPAVKDFFGDYEVVSTEEMLKEPIPGQECDFKGFIDAVIKTPDGKYHIIDWKTCSWGWDQKRRTEPMTTYQLTLYKYYFCQKHDIDPKDVETYFALLKRTAKSDKVEIFRVTSGPKKTKNALNLLNKALYNINKANRTKIITDTIFLYISLFEFKIFKIQYTVKRDVTCECPDGIPNDVDNFLFFISSHI